MSRKPFPRPRQRRPLQELIAPILGYAVCDKPDGEPGTEWIKRKEFRVCGACGNHYHQSWGGLCPECTGS